MFLIRLYVNASAEQKRDTESERVERGQQREARLLQHFCGNNKFRGFEFGCVANFNAFHANCEFCGQLYQTHSHRHTHTRTHMYSRQHIEIKSYKINHIYYEALFVFFSEHTLKPQQFVAGLKFVSLILMHW